MDNNQRDNKNIIIGILSVLLIIVTISLILVLVNSTNSKTVERLTERVEKIKEEEKRDAIYYLDDTPEEYVETMCAWIGNELPTFTNINEADPEWIWGNVRNLFEYVVEKAEVEYDEITEFSKLIYGDNLNLRFPKEGGYGFDYDDASDLYVIDSSYYEGDYLEFTVKNMDENENQVTVDIIEYSVGEETNDNGDVVKIVLYDKNGNEIKSYDIEDSNELLDNYYEKLEEIEADTKNLNANLRVVLEKNEDEMYNIVSITEV